jgi:hypothetical protein
MIYLDERRIVNRRETEGMESYCHRKVVDLP